MIIRVAIAVIRAWRKLPRWMKVPCPRGPERSCSAQSLAALEAGAGLMAVVVIVGTCGACDKPPRPKLPPLPAKGWWER